MSKILILFVVLIGLCNCDDTVSVSSPTEGATEVPTEDVYTSKPTDLNVSSTESSSVSSTDVTIVSTASEITVSATLQTEEIGKSSSSIETTISNEGNTSSTPEATIYVDSTSPASETTTNVADSSSTPVTISNVTDTGTTIKNGSEVVINKISDQIRKILKHFQEPEPMGLPGQTVLMDPMGASNVSVDLVLGTGNFSNITIHGLSKFTIEAVNTYLDQLEVYMLLKLKKVVILGDCVIQTLFTKSTGPFKVTLYNVTAEGTVYLAVDKTGKLTAQRAISNIAYEELNVDSNADSAVQSILNGAGIALFYAVKPYIMSHIEERIITEANKHLASIPRVPAIANISPIDLAIIQGRKFVREHAEPYSIDIPVNYNDTFLQIKIGPAVIHGLSNFARVGNVTLSITNGTMQFGIRMITGILRGSCEWFIDFGRMGSGSRRHGHTIFEIDHLQLEAKVSQSLDIRKKLTLDDLQLEVGTIKPRMDGAGEFDYLVELIVPRIPSLIRHLIVDELEGPIKSSVQEQILNRLDMEQIFESSFPFIDSIFTNPLSLRK